MRRDEFRSDISFTGESWKVALFGELDIATVPEAETALQVVRAVPGSVTLDLRGLQFMDACGVHLILRLDDVARRDGFDLCVVAAGRIVRRVLKITGIDACVNVVDACSWSDSPSSRPEYAVIATDMGGSVTIWNSEAQRLYGWSAFEARGRSIIDLTVGPEDRQTAAEIMAQVHTMGRWEGEFEVRSKTGSRFPAHVTDVLIRGDNGDLLGIVGLSVKSSERALTLT